MSIKDISKKLIDTAYLSRWVVLGIDTFISTISTLLVYKTLVFFTSTEVSGRFFLHLGILSLAVSISVFVMFGTYRGIMRHTSMYEVLRIFISLLAKASALYVLFILFKVDIGFKTFSLFKIFIAQVTDLMATMFMMVVLRVVLIHIYFLIMLYVNGVSNRVLIYGNDARSVALADYLTKSKYSEFKVVGYFVVDRKVGKFKISGLPVYTIYSYDYFKRLIKKREINTIIFSDQKYALEEKDRIIDYCIKEHIKVMLLPQLGEAVNTNKKFHTQIRDIKVEDLLGRDEIKINMAEIQSFLENKVVMVTGAAGSIGSELCRLISSFPIRQLVLLDNAETPLHNIQLEMIDKEYDKGVLDEAGILNKYKFVLADVRNRVRINTIFDKYKPQIVFHAAAYKHVPMMESNPTESVNVNVIGTKVVADAAVRIGVEKMIMVSTDKAVNPTNVMGASKRIAEIYVQSLSKAILGGKVEGKTKFITTRFGNVLGSNGSVIPLFREQIMQGGPVTVTHQDIIRYFMTIPEACRLVLEAATMGEGAEIFVFDMGKPVKISDLARNMIALAGFEPDVDIKIKYTGLRPGEKLYEELLNEKEQTTSTEHEKISIAKVRDYEYSSVEQHILELKNFARQSDFYESVRVMKEIVPEFKSQNSIYSELDKKKE